MEIATAKSQAQHVQSRRILPHAGGEQELKDDEEVRHHAPKGAIHKGFFRTPAGIDNKAMTMRDVIAHQRCNPNGFFRTPAGNAKMNTMTKKTITT